MLLDTIISAFTNNPLTSQLAVWQAAAVIAIIAGAIVKKKAMWAFSYLLIVSGSIWCIVNILAPAQLFNDVVCIIGFGIFAFELLIQFIVHGVCVSAKHKAQM